MATDFRKVSRLVSAFETLSGEMARVKARLSPRERLAFAAGLRVGHIRKARSQGDLARARAHLAKLMPIRARLCPMRTLRERGAFRAGVSASYAEEGLAQGKMVEARPHFESFARLMVALGGV